VSWSLKWICFVFPAKTNLVTKWYWNWLHSSSSYKLYLHIRTQAVGLLICVICLSRLRAVVGVEMATVWTVRGSNPVVCEIFALVQTCSGPTQPPAQWVLVLFSGAKQLRAWFWPPIPIEGRDERKSRAVPLHALWACMACSRV